jgi:HEAT repeat protein
VSHPLVEKLASADPEERRAACAEAARDPAAALLADALARTLGDADKGVARAASDALAQIGRQAESVGGALRAALGGGDPNRRFWAAFTFARLEPPGQRWWTRGACTRRC